MAMHQGRVLKDLTKESGLTQEDAAKAFKYSRAGFRLLFKEEKLKEDIIKKACEIFNVERNEFFPMESVLIDGNSTYNRPTQKGGQGNVQVIGTYYDCMSELVTVQKALIAEKDRTIQLQDEINEMLKKQISDGSR
ncbi:hypothetical protein ACFS7Z_13870 [Pontibacter toksunensis]|uniref:HTH cro/C1-type domain-containing protein n=1 Tax=Pontibacter toksunensis TaxID=1332631 RepID=A0ABW6BUG1_9BACT